jgi:hypothetical protein
LWTVAIGLVVLVPIRLDAQDASRPATTLEAAAIESGADLLITKTDGTRTRGTLRAITSGALTLGAADTQLVMQVDEIAKVEHRDPISDGGLIGAGVGFASLIVFRRMTCSSNDSECEAIVNAYIGAPAVGVGALVGAMADSARRRTLFESPQPGRAALAVSPVLSKRERGIALNLTW